MFNFDRLSLNYLDSDVKVPESFLPVVLFMYLLEEFMFDIFFSFTFTVLTFVIIDFIFKVILSTVCRFPFQSLTRPARYLRN